MKKGSRPAEFDVWMKTDHPWKDQLVNDGFMANWWTWWNTIKVLPENGIVGPSGVMLLVIGLAWWGVHVKEEGHA